MQFVYDKTTNRVFYKLQGGSTLPSNLPVRLCGTNSSMRSFANPWMSGGPKTFFQNTQGMSPSLHLGTIYKQLNIVVELMDHKTIINFPPVVIQDPNPY